MISVRYYIIITSILILRFDFTFTKYLGFRAPRCYIQTSTEVSPEEDCDIKYDIDGCIDQNDVVTKFFNEKWTDVSYETSQPSSFHLNVSLSISTPAQDPVVLTISGVTALSGVKRCVTISFSGVAEQPKSIVTLHANLLELPEGAYNLTGLRTLSSPLSGKEKSIASYPKHDVHHRPVAHRSFNLSASRRNRREEEDRREFPKPCFNSSYHEYIPTKYFLKFHYNTKDLSCYNIQLTLMRFASQDTNASACLNLTVEEALSDLSTKSIQKANKFLLEFMNVSPGCYIIHAPGPAYYGFFWLEGEDYLDTTQWNTTIVVTPRSVSRSLEIRWEVPDPPLNFSSWHLRLFYNESKPFQCWGTASLDGNSKECSAPFVHINQYLFSNLSAGYYCVWLEPVDKILCPTQSCPARATDTYILDAPPEIEKDETKTPSWIIYLATGLSVVLGLSVAILCYSFTKNSLHTRTIYKPVPQEMSHLKPVEVLIIWSKHRQGVEFEDIVSAFKSLLKSYSKCKIYDYSDINSFSPFDRQEYISKPTEWLLETLKDPVKKIIFIESQNERKKEWPQQPMNGIHRQNVDEELFSCALRYLKESLKLASNYERIFYVRFPGLYKPENDLDEIVPSMRFDIPNHLRSLTLKLRGLSEDTLSGFPYPNTNELSELHNLINNCKNSHK